MEKAQTSLKSRDRKSGGGEESTRSLLLRSAAEVFQSRGYHGASVAEICRRSGLANGTFYRYFENKAAAFLALAGEMASRLVANVEVAVRASADVTGFVRAYLLTFLEFVAQNRALYQIFRETEFVDRRVALAFYDALTAAVARGLRMSSDSRPLDGAALATADFVVGTPLLWAVNQVLWEGRPAQETGAMETLADFLTDGLGGRPALEGGVVAEAVKVAQLGGAAAPGGRLVALLPGGRGGEATRQKLLRAAEIEVGRRGFHDTSVADITRRARVGLGTFYLHFQSKHEMLQALVEAINEALRRHLSERTRAAAAVPGGAAPEDRRVRECLGLVAFLGFIERHRDIYRVVREAEFVDESLARWYYRRLAEPYARALSRAMAQGQIRPGDPAVLAYALMGVGHFIGVRWVVWKEQRPPLTKAVIEQVLRLVLFGLSGVA